MTFREFSDRTEEFLLDTFFGWIVAMLAFCLVLIAISGIAFWIFGDHSDYGQCLQFHPERTVVYVSTGKIMTPIYGNENVCDVWQYPQGK